MEMTRHCEQKLDQRSPSEDVTSGLWKAEWTGLGQGKSKRVFLEDGKHMQNHKAEKGDAFEELEKKGQCSQNAVNQERGGKRQDCWNQRFWALFLVGSHGRFLFLVFFHGKILRAKTTWRDLHFKTASLNLS